MRLKVMVNLLLVMFLAGIPAVWGKDYGTITSGFTLPSQELDLLSKMDTYHFTGVAGERVIFNAVQTSGTLDTEMFLYYGSNPAEATTAPWGDQLSHQLKNTGEYTLLVQDHGLDNTGNYNLSFLKLPGGPLGFYNDGDGVGGDILSGRTLKGTINEASDMDAFQFEGKAGERVIISCVEASGTLDTEFSLYYGSNPAVATTAPWGDKMDYQLTKDGKYTILVQDHGLDNVGDYYLSFLKLADSSLNWPGDLDGRTIVSGEMLSGKINITSDMDAYQFLGKAGERVIINCVETLGTLDTEFYLYYGSDPAVATTAPWGDQMDYQLLKDGIYTILVQDHGLDNTGDYNLSFLKLNGPLNYSGDLDGRAIVSGETLSAKINAISDVDAFKFTGKAGERIIINCVETLGTLDTEFSLYYGNDPAVATTAPWGDQLNYLLLKGGTYTIVIQDHGLDNTGDYNLSFLKLPAGPLGYKNDLDGGTVISGQTKSGKINAASDMDAFQFYGVAGERVIVSAVKTAGTLDTEMYLYAENGDREASTAPWGDRLEYQLKQTGLYTILVQDNGLDNTGDYNLSFIMVSGKVYYPKADFTYYYNNGKGDLHSGVVYGKQECAYYKGYTKKTPTASGLDENGQPGYYLITGYTLVTDTSKIGQVFVDRYYDAETTKYYDPLNKGKAVGTDCLGSEVDYLSPVADGSVRFGKYDNIFWEADIGASPEYNKYSFKYTYGSTLEYYTGVVYAGADRGYYAGKKWTLPKADENGVVGSYEITKAEYDPAITTAMLGQVLVNSYYDAESKTPYTPVSWVGSNYLGSEGGYIIKAGVKDFRFGLGYYEADVGNRYTFRYTYENKDYYEGWVYAAPTYGYFVGRKILKKNETGKTGYYYITGMAFSSSYTPLDKQVYISKYFDGDMSGKPYTPTLGTGSPAGTAYLGGEAGYIVKAGNPDFYFGKGYYEADVGDRFAFMYSYGNEDFYTGYVYADPSRYYLGWESAKVNELNETGWYEIIGKAYTGKSAEYGKVYVNGYFNGDQDGKMYTPVSATTAKGSSHLGSEVGYILRSNVAAYKFGQGNWEADVGDRYSFIYTYGNGDFYNGIIYAAPTWGYYPSWKSSPKVNETGKLGWYRITGMSYQGVSTSLYGKVIVKNYYDGSATDKYYSPLSASTYFGLTYLGSEYGYIKVLNNAAYKFGGGYEETDGS